MGSSSIVHFERNRDPRAGLTVRLKASQPAPVALRGWFDQLAAYGRIKHGLADALYSVMRETLAGEGYSSIVDAITLLLDAGKKSGTVRPDINAEEMLLLVGFLWRIEPDEGWEARSSHLLDLVMDAARPPLHNSATSTVLPKS
jgi:hypothetical protein